MTPELERVVRSEARRVWWPGAELEDREQEAREAILRGGEPAQRFPRNFARRRLIELARRETLTGRDRLRRRAITVELVDAPAQGDLVERVAARLELRRVLETPMPPNERRALARAIGGAGNARGAEAQSWYRARGRLLSEVAA